MSLPIPLIGIIINYLDLSQEQFGDYPSLLPYININGYIVNTWAPPIIQSKQITSILVTGVRLTQSQIPPNIYKMTIADGVLTTMVADQIQLPLSLKTLIYLCTDDFGTALNHFPMLETIEFALCYRHQLIIPANIKMIKISCSSAKHVDAPHYKIVPSDNECQCLIYTALAHNFFLSLTNTGGLRYA